MNGTNPSRILSIFLPILLFLISLIVPVHPASAAVMQGSLWSWGYNADGQLGNGFSSVSSTPVKAGSLTGITAVAAGDNHTVALDSTGEVWAWGHNYNGQLGNGTNTDSASPGRVSALSGIVAVAAGAAHSLALDSNGNVRAWGLNVSGQLGNDTTTNSTVPVRVSNLTGIVAIAAGGNHSLALDSNGHVWAWGINDKGELGNNTTEYSSTVPVQVTDLTGIIAIAAGGEHCLALDRSGKVWSWGSNEQRQLGDGNVSGYLNISRLPVPVANLSGIVAITAGGGSYHSLALDSNGNVWAWGYNVSGQLGNGTSGLSSSSFVPVQVSNLSGIAAVATGRESSFALDSSGSLWVWGNNPGNGTSSLPIVANDLSGIKAVAAGSSHALAVDANSTLWSWGSNASGQLGIGPYNRNTPGRVSDLTGVVAVAGGTVHSLALDASGNVWAWGSNSGQLGNGTYTSSNVPVQVSSINGVKAVAAGGTHSLALGSSGNVWAWGYNGYGQLGIGTTDTSDIPVRINGLTAIVAIAAGNSHSLALDSSGAVWAWGSSTRGQLGNGVTGSNSTMPVRVSNLAGIVTIAAGAFHNLALDSSGAVWAWGDNDQGQLGNGTNIDGSMPVQVRNLTGVVAIAAGGAHSMALDSSGNIWTWGWNASGQLGVGTLANSNIPVRVSTLVGIVAIEAGGYHSLALDSSGNVWAWGMNRFGELGTGSDTSSNIPVRVSNLSGVTAIAAGGEHSLAISGCVTNTIVRTASYIPLGRSVWPEATVTNLGACSSVPTGTITFEISTDNGATWSDFGSARALNSSGTATSNRYTPPAPGTYQIRAIYSGDDGHSGSQSSPEEGLGVLAVYKARTDVISELSATTIHAINSVTATITIYVPAGGILPEAGGNWVVQASRDSSFSTGVVTLAGGPVSGTFPIKVTTAPLSFAKPGTLYLRTVYTGDSNFSKSSASNVLTVVQ